jgi:hypothetical protein
MMKINLVAFALLMAVILTGLNDPVWADRGPRNVSPANKNFVLDNRHNHNRHYPKPGYVINVLPNHARLVTHRRSNYYFHGGVWYRPGSRGYAVVRPPIGIVVPFLPPFYTTIWAGAVPYYYADGVYYNWRARERVYVISDPPPEQEVVEQSALPKDLFIYPKEGQNKEQQATDRYECHRWAVGETGFDPVQPGGNVPEAQHNNKEIDYQRAIKACLEARNYSVQ